MSKTIQGTISVGSPVPKLTLDKKEFCNCGKFNTVESKAVPTSIASGSSYSFSYYTPPVSLDATQIIFYYKIGQGPFYLAGYTYLPHLGANQKSCKIQYRDRTDTSASPYVCSVSFAESSNPYIAKPVFNVGEKPIKQVTDSDEQVALMKDYFSTFCATGNYERCTFTNTKVQYFQTSPAQQVGRLQQNCTESELEYEVRWKTEHSEENSFGVKLKGEIGFKIGEAVKAGVALELAYEHKWVDTVSFDETTRIKVPPGKVGGIYLSSGNVTVTGDFRLVGDDMIYLLNDVHVTYPIDGTAKDPFGKVYEPIVTSRITGDAPCGESTK